MQQLVRVQKCNDDGTAIVLHVRESACSGDCHQCSGCGGVQEKMLLKANNSIGAKPGQVVTIRTKLGPVLAAAAVLYLLPLMLFFIGYLIFSLVWGLGGLGGCLAFLLGVVIAWIYDRRATAKEKTVYTITGFGYMSRPLEKGDNDLD